MLIETANPAPRRFRRTRRAGQRALSVAILGVWVLMPLLPVIAVVFTLLDCP